MALPRFLSLDEAGALRMMPLKALESLRRDAAAVQAGDRNLAKALGAIRIRGLSGELKAQFRAQRAFRLRLRSEKGDRFVEIAYDPQQKESELKANGVAGALDTKEPVTLRVFVDGSVIEVFANDRVAITARVYTVPSGPLQVDLLDENGASSVEIWGMQTISSDRLTGAGDREKKLSRGEKGAKRAKSL